MSNIVSLIQKVPVPVLIAFSASSVIIGDLLAKYWSTSFRTPLFVGAILAYMMSGVFYIPTLLTKGLVVTSLAWSLLSIIGFMFIGLVVFRESLTTTQIIGAALGVVSLVFLSL
ncbi:hypothetical protein A3C96_00520 [Candidatus Uhrbacteria bacterium RIFCSPHIGHO2_02_FULL_60_10]|uniref:EamA domain-containing protein n=1 Tax=Candidatus Uhrbacteria bacterium RIFCSPHIGHO2_02_FULL_60_10 TaxID=1802392 RepID=A0A1F7U8A8_9BACT|nr:MAG: hypothetical protein A3C96_00520 [Candidatus Uhrbacteria bacterium RIFCSPHIGHO2_02_FULL_60_10]